jgi:hypothetical protein
VLGSVQELVIGSVLKVGDGVGSGVGAGAHAREEAVDKSLLGMVK